jgi:O-antigen/teichoic acid export membrane protein
MATRFVLVFVLAKVFVPDDVGLYGLVTSMVSYALYVLGLDFYTFANRELIRAEPSERRAIIRSQVGFEAVVYAIVLPLCVVIFLTGLLPWSLVGWFYALLVLEHVSSEINRLLISLMDQTRASIVLFLRMALVPLVTVPLMIAVPSLRHLPVFLGAWVACDALAVAFGIRFTLRHLPTGQWGRVDWAWVRRGLRTCLLYIVGTLCLRFLFTADRQIVHHADTLAAVAAYTFFMGIGNAVTSILDVTLYQFAYPELIRAVHEGRVDLVRRKTKMLFLQALAVTAVVTALALVATPVVVGWVGNSVYADYEWILPLILAAMAVYNLGMVPHYGLYGFGADRTIMAVTIAAAAAFSVTVAVLLLLDVNALVTVVAGIGAASFVLLGGKSVALARRLKAAPTGAETA